MEVGADMEQAHFQFRNTPLLLEVRLVLPAVVDTAGRNSRETSLALGFCGSFCSLMLPGALL